jgi:hypothetical protein
LCACKCILKFIIILWALFKNVKQVKISMFTIKKYGPVAKFKYSKESLGKTMHHYINRITI